MEDIMKKVIVLSFAVIISLSVFAADAVVVKTVASGDFSVVLKDNGTVYVGGDDKMGGFGNGPFGYINECLEIPNLRNIVDISASYAHVLALDNDGKVWVWGHNENGQLGLGYTSDLVKIPTMIDDLDGIVAISACGSCSLALKNDGTLWGWGFGPNDIDSSVPVLTTDISEISDACADASNLLSLGKSNVVADNPDVSHIIMRSSSADN
jgi:alpha-tubulin suppressor-like RCC1 family protein